jgi:hypothetical protein
LAGVQSRSIEEIFFGIVAGDGPGIDPRGCPNGENARSEIDQSQFPLNRLKIQAGREFV